MKSFCFITVIILLSLLSCQNSNPIDKCNQDSSFIPNELTETEVTNQMSDQFKEKAKLDSFQRDSITKANEEKKKFLEKIPDPNKILKHYCMDSEKYLQSLGYKGKIKPIDIESAEGNFSYKVGKYSCKMYLGGDECEEIIIATISDKEALEIYYNKAKKLAFKKKYEYCNVSKKGNKVTINYVFNCI